MAEDLCLVIKNSIPGRRGLVCLLPRAGFCSVVGVCSDVLEPLLPLNSIHFGDRDLWCFYWVGRLYIPVARSTLQVKIQLRETVRASVFFVRLRLHEQLR